MRLSEFEKLTPVLKKTVETVEPLTESAPPTPAPTPAPRNEEDVSAVPRPLPFGAAPAGRIDWAHALRVYGEAVDAVRAANRGAMDKAANRQRVADAALALCLNLQKQPTALLSLANRSTAGNYLHAHAVNTAIFTIRTAFAAPSDIARLSALAEAALWHDAALALHLGLCRLGRPIPSDRFAEAALHPLESSEHFHSLDETVSAFEEKLTWLMGHELPGGAKTAAQLINLCALYESMSHPRPWRAAFLPHVAVKLIAGGHKHEPCGGLLKPFLRQMSLYPVGSWVRLSHGEVGAVANVQTGALAHPEVEVFLGPDNDLKDPPEIVDLKTSPMTHVKEAVDPFSEFMKHPRFLSLLRLGQWWVP